MIARTFPAAWYCDVAIDGRWAVLCPEGPIWLDIPDQIGRVLTDAGEVSLPPGGNPLFLRLGPGRRLAGSGHQDDLSYEWDGTAWAAGPKVYGNNACAYDLAGWLHVVTAWPPSGIRTFAEDGTPNGRLVTCDETMADLSRQIWQYTELPGGITVGQGGAGEYGEDPLIVLAGGQRYVVQTGRCRFIRAYRQSSDLALAWVQEDTREARLLWLTVAELATFPVEPLPPPIPPPQVHLTVTPTSGPIPLTVRGTVTTTDATTWRWLKDGTIDGSDGQTHAYLFEQAGDHTVAVRAAGPGGVTETPPHAITATTPIPVTGLPGLVCWGEQETADTYRWLADHGWEAIRLTLTHLPTDRLAAAVAVPQAAGLRVVAMIWPPAQIDGLPDGIDVELGNEMDAGCAPLPKLSPAAYAAQFTSILLVAQAKGITLWTGGLSNISPPALDWLRDLLPLIPAETPVAVHRYPQHAGDRPQDGRDPYGSRAAEVAALKATIGPTRRYAISELGYSQEKRRSHWFWWTRWSDADIKAFWAWERTFWQARGAAFTTWYQINDGASGPAFGMRRSDQTWKPQATLIV